MKKFFIFAIVATIAIIAAVKVTSDNGNVVKITSMANMEAIAGCETSSDAGQNVGYCVPKVGGGDACVTQSDNDAVRCSGNY